MPSRGGGHQCCIGTASHSLVKPDFGAHGEARPVCRSPRDAHVSIIGRGCRHEQGSTVQEFDMPRSFGNTRICSAALEPRMERHACNLVRAPAATEHGEERQPPLLMGDQTVSPLNLRAFRQHQHPPPPSSAHLHFRVRDPSPLLDDLLRLTLARYGADRRATGGRLGGRLA